MKWIFLVALLFLAACTTEIRTEEQATIEEKPIIVLNGAPESEEVEIQAPILNKPDVEKMMNGTRRFIEVVGITEDGDKCLIRVGDTTAFIEEGQTKEINGVRIHVLDILLLHAEPDEGMCRLIL